VERPESLLADSQRRSGRRFAISGTSGSMRKSTDVVKHCRHLGMLSAEARDQNVQRARIEGGGLIKLAGVLEQHCKVVTHPGRQNRVVCQ
jgi:hypothetical protein